MKLFLLLTFLLPSFLWAQLRINEGSNANGTTLVQADGSNPDWLEIYNASGSALNLLGYALSDDATMPLKWVFPNHTIAGSAFLTVLASGVSNTDIIDHYETAVSAGDTWQYFIPSGTVAANWNTVGFGAGGWTSAPLGIGYGDGDDATTVANPQTSIYVRKLFTITDVSSIKEVIFDVDYDDGFVAYINGVEIARAGLAGNPPAWNELSSSHEAQLYQSVPLSTFSIDTALFNSLVTNGTNVLAIEVHNAATNSSDLSLIPFLSFGFNQSTVYYGGTVHPYFASVSSSSLFGTNFSIKTQGETIYLSDPSGIIIDSLVVPDLEPDMSVGKFTDGMTNNSLFITPTPGATNNLSIAYSGMEETPVINVAGGFFTAATTVTLTNTSTNGGVLRYTIDGQVPTLTSLVYTGPISLSTNAVLKVRCIPVLTTLLPSDIATETYFFMEDFTLPVISISTDPVNLYGATGIFDNYTTDWRKPCVIEYYDADGQKQFESRASIKPDGGAGGSRSNPQHSVTIEPAHPLYGEGNPVHYPLIPEKSFIKDFSAFYLRNGSNFWNNYPQKDATFMRIMRETNANSQAYSPVIAFVNGQYFGVYELREKANEAYFEANYGNNKDSLDLLSVSYFYGAGVLRTVKGSDSSFYNMRSFIMNNNPMDLSYYNRCDTKLDLDNFADYIAGENWYANFDWIYNNMKIARTRSTDNKWRFFLQDMELGLGAWGNYNSNLFDYFRYNNLPNPYWDIYNGLIQNPKFKNYFVNRYADLMNTIFQPEYYTPIIDTMYNQLLPELPRHFQTWTGDIPGGMATYANTHNDLYNQFSNRNAVVRSQIVNEFGLAEQVNVTLDVSPAGAGYIKISTIVPSTLPWTGVYFDGVPVRMTVVANPGYTFTNWQSNSLIPSVELTNTSIELNISNDDSFVALFTGAPETLAVTISEIHYNPEASVDGGNWIELHNYGTTPLDLTNWSVKSKNFYDKYTFDDQTVIPANGYLVVCQDTALFSSQYPLVQNRVGATGFPWSNSYDSIQVFNAFKQTVLMTVYRDKTPFPECADGWGRTLENRYLQSSQLDSSSWFCGCIGGSPGKAYTPCQEPIQVTEINYNNIDVTYNAGDWIELRNNTGSAINLAGYTFQDSKNSNMYVLPATNLNPGDFIVLSNELNLFGARHSSVENVTGTFNFGLAPKDVIRIYDNNGVLVNSILYNAVAPWPISPSVSDFTLEYSYTNGYEDPNSSTSWFAGCEGGSPGRAWTPCPVLADGQDVNLYPNPTSGSLNVVFNNEGNSSNSTDIELYDLNGRIIHRETIVAIESIVKQEIDVNFLGNGMYFIRVIQAGRTVQLPFVKI